MYITKQIFCPKCGYEETGDHLEIFADDTLPDEERDEKSGGILRVYHCPGRGKETCGRTLRPRMINLPYGPRFERGEKVKVFAPQTRDWKMDSEYPLRRLHGRVVTVLDPMPHRQGAVLVKLNPVLRSRSGDIAELPILQTLLHSVTPASEKRGA